mmetsp:Transcript_10508/g.23648  ORF Transcript_10508/g.23648 Transcript_10508/m.23648 type:complete len:261 (-) Transcript_10508:180-962(-)|eukprot:CAMPEP_0170620124 /NCGR_PEP_ID=MMETSP0224-20130122/27890_1 /TAXON_ID=285029 /ORGANISM="Togula jolla, Strain CCCM 725" /LENGTH=260 /DNA_ID=CAMNT_0010946275 /DNA_START=147 /DNA_END=929 /DNA_ORIENTATION=+
MKVIFLDIDGVLVTRRPGVFEEHLLHNLRRLVTQSGAKIVLSSDWRRHPQARQEAARVLATVGLSFISCTPCLSVYLAQRPTEIMQWRLNHKKLAGAEPLSHWVAIDDRELLEERHGSHLRGHFVQTHPMRGLTDDAVNQCMAILSTDSPRNGTPAGGNPLSPVRRGTSVDPGNAWREGSSGSSIGGSYTVSIPTQMDPRPREDLAQTAKRREAAVATAAAASSLSAAVVARSLAARSTAPAGLSRARGRSMGATVGIRR